MTKEWSGRPVYSVSEIVSILSQEVEQAFPDVWVEGEVSGFKRAASGHCYFALKDARASLKAVLFRTHALRLPFEPESGTLVLARGKLSVYESTGDLQLYVTALEPAGLGALQMAFEQAKKRLMAEGLTDPSRKRAIPPFPARVGVVTSLEGAALRDVLSVLTRRKAHFDVVLSPARVQGEKAAESLRAALAKLARVPGVEVVLLTRGGGSMEDLWPFNDEALARDVAAFPVPVVSAVGHEVDTVLTDFTADLRAPTPSVAAEFLTSKSEAVSVRSGEAGRRISSLVRSRLLRLGERLGSCVPDRQGRLLARRLELLQERCDRLAEGLSRSAFALLERDRHRLELSSRSLSPEALARWLRDLSARRTQASAEIARAARALLERRRAEAASLFRTLHSLSPLAVLGRGYAAAFAPGGRLVTRAEQAPAGSSVSVALTEGALDCTVTGHQGGLLPLAARAALGLSVDARRDDPLESPREEADRGREKVRAEDPGGRKDG
jgi:exodeoxyribonuclease VII large subunit